MKKDLLSIKDLTGEEIHSLILDAIDLKADGWLSALGQRTLAIVFEKPSLRTRVSLEMAMRQLGGLSIYLSASEVGLNQRESVKDVAKVLSRYVSAIAARTFSHQTLEVLAENAQVPIINALSDLEHPCQALADLMTIYEKKGRLQGLTLAFIGDGNNVANSLLLAASLCGMNFTLAAPDGFGISDDYLELAYNYAATSHAKIRMVNPPAAAVDRADVIYTDVWISMGQENETKQRREKFSGYTVNEELLSLADRNVILMHPLPAHYGEEVVHDILDSRQSVVFDQAENRMHIQKALLLEMLGRSDILSD